MRSKYLFFLFVAVSVQADIYPFHNQSDPKSKCEFTTDPSSELSGQILKNKKPMLPLYCVYNDQFALQFSKDGRYLALGSCSVEPHTHRTGLIVYDCKEEKFQVLKDVDAGKINCGKEYTKDTCDPNYLKPVRWSDHSHELVYESYVQGKTLHEQKESFQEKSFKAYTGKN